MSSLAITLGNYDIKDALDDKTFNYNICNMYLLDNQDLSDTTIKSYRTYLKQFILWLKSNKIIKPTEDTIKAYKLYLKDSDNYTIATKNQYIRAVKHLFKWLDSRGIYPNIAINIKEFKDVRKHKRDSLTIKEINKIINDIDISNEIGLRDKVIIINILGKGYQEKSNKKAIPQQVYLVIQDYLKVKKGVKPSDALFTSTSN